MAMNFPNSPIQGDTYTFSNRTYVYDGTKWVRSLNNLTLDFLDFDEAASVSPLRGRVYFDGQTDTLAVVQSNGVIQQVGQSFYLPHTINVSGVTITKGSFVMAVGAQGDRISIARAVTNGTIDPKFMLGVAAEDITNTSDTGKVLTDGVIAGLNTLAWPVGTVLYPNPSVAGGLTSTPPTAPNIRTSIAIVVKSNATDGVIYVRMTTGSVLGGTDSNVNFSSLATGDLIVYNATTGIWENKTQSTITAGNATKWATARTITLGGDLTGNVSIDGSANVTLTATVAANSVALGTDTTGNYVADVTAGSYITKSGTASEGWSPTIAVDATSANTASKVVARDASGNFSAGAITSTNYLVTTASSTQASGAAIQRVFTKAISAGQLYQLCSYNDTEGTIAFDIQVSSETSGNSGTSTYHWEGGFSALAVGSYYRLLPANSGRGHGDGPDTGLNSNAWEVYVYGIDGYTYGIAVAVPTGRTAKTLVTTVTETARGMTFVDLSATAVITSWTNAGNIYSTRSLLVESGISGNTLTSRVATGTAPLTVSSTTAVTNLNADLLDGQHGSYYLDWTNVTNKPDPVVTVTLTGDVTGTGNATLTDLASGNISFATTIAANSVALGTDTTGNYVAGVTAGTGISVSGTAGEGWSPTVTLATAGTAGTYTKVTTDVYGRVSSGSTLLASDIPDLTMEKLPSSAFKRSVRVATTANITLSGTQTIDGVAVVAGDRVLVKNQTTASQNGIYVVAAGAWTRALDADANTEISCAVVAVDSGTANGAELWTNTFRATDTLGTTAMNWFEVLYNSGTWGISVSGSAATLTTGRTIAMTGDVTWTSASFNGSGNVTGTSTLSNSGVTAGTYTKVTVDAKGRVTVGANLASADVTTALGYTPYNSTNPNGYTSNTGTVTSVAGTGTVSGLTLSGTVTTTGNITLGGTLAVTPSNFSSQTANTFLAAPSGTAGVPTFRTIVAADVPTLNQSTTGSAATLTTGRTIAMTGDVAWTSASFNGSANVTGTSTLATVNSNVGTFGSSAAIPVVTVNAKGLVTAVTTATVAGGQYFGSAATKAIAYNSQTIAENVTVTAGNNGYSAGPVTINDGFTVTVQDGARWVII
jgi:hypothetical protein